MAIQHPSLRTLTCIVRSPTAYCGSSGVATHAFETDAILFAFTEDNEVFEYEYKQHAHPGGRELRAHPRRPLNPMAVLKTQPFKGTYLLLEVLVTALIRVPLWIAFAIPRQNRIRPSWTIKRQLMVKAIQRGATIISR